MCITFQLLALAIFCIPKLINISYSAIKKVKDKKCIAIEAASKHSLNLDNEKKHSFIDSKIFGNPVHSCHVTK